MNTLEHLSFLYPNAVTVGVILIALLVIYLAGKALAWVFSSTEKKVEHEPSVLTELDELRRSNEKLSTMYDQLAYDHDVLGKECSEYKSVVESFHIKYNELLTELDAQIKTTQETQKLYLNTHNESHERLMRIYELEKELSNLRSSCDDSFLNTIERANQLSLKCASLENTIAEFDVYKKDAQEVNDRITKLYEAEVAAKKELYSKLWHSRREVAKLNRDLISAAIQIKELGDKYTSSEKERGEYESMYNSILAQYAELKVKLNAIEQAKAETKPDISSLSWAKWVATDETGDIWAYSDKPIKLNYSWEAADEAELITPVMAIVLCDRVPGWSDEEPTPVISNITERDQEPDPAP